MVIFGAFGDLTKRLVVPALYNLACTNVLPRHFALIGVDLADGDGASWRAHLHAMLASFVGNASAEFNIDAIDEEVWRWLMERTSYIQGDLTTPALYALVGGGLETASKLQGFGIVTGHGLEVVLTLGTGAGTAVFRDGELMPHLELSQHPIHNGKTYDDYISDHARKRHGKKKRGRHVRRTIGVLESLLNYDTLYLGGGNAAKAARLPAGVVIASNDAGISEVAGKRHCHSCLRRKPSSLSDSQSVFHGSNCLHGHIRPV